MSIVRGAGFSTDRVHRYWLLRGWAPTAAEQMDRALVVVGLNPSTADEMQDDPTIRRCMGFARSWGHGGLVMLNLFAFRSTDPRGLLDRATRDPVGPENDRHLTEWTDGRRVLCAWGVHGAINGRGADVLRLLRALERDLVCLGVTKDGHPKHPLYIRADTLPVPFGRKESDAPTQPPR